MEGLFSVENGVALLTLTLLEIVLGIDNIVFLSILTSKLPPAQQPRARRIGLLLAMGMRILLLMAIGWIVKLTAPLIAVAGQEISGRDLILLGGGLFLLAKATWEIHDKLEGAERHTEARAASFGAVLLQIVLVDAVFSLDSVITAVGLARHLAVMIAAVMIAIGVMMAFAETVSGFVERHPTIKMLALAFLILIGVMLVAEAFEQHVNRGYIYFAMFFSLSVEMLNIRMRKAAVPVQLHHTEIRHTEGA
jgi:predicted tellurium resistance membrane protein TerC